MMFRWQLCFLVSLLYASAGVLGHASCSTAAVTAATTGRDDCTYPSLVNATSDELQGGLEKGCFTSANLVEAYVQRIHEVNSTLHMVLEINPDAMRIAHELDEERKRGSIRGPLHGLPILVKGLIATKDETETSAGSYALVGAKVPEDSTVVTKLRENGVIILGKTSLSEWANFRSTNSTDGWNALGGQTYAAYYPDQSPSGSSSGSAVSADLGLALATLGTETNGSILWPSQVSNIVGIKPTVGLTSRHMVIPVSERQDSIGPMARTVKDAAMVLQAMVSQDPKDNYTLASPFAAGFPNYVAACKPSGLEGKRIGIPRNVLSDGTEPITSAFENAIDEMSAAGAIIVEDANFTAYEESLTSQTSNFVTAADFISNLARYLSGLEKNPNDVHSLSDIRDFTRKFPLEEYPSRDTGLWDITLAAGMNNTSPEFWSMYQEVLQIGGEGGVLGALSRQNLDAVILPTTLAPAMPAMVGSPVITVPLGAFPNGTEIQHGSRGDTVQSAPGIPFGISFLGAKWSEEPLIGMAYAFEQRTLRRDQIRRYIEPKTELSDVL